MRMILLLTVAGFILVTVGLFALYLQTCSRLYAIEKELKARKGELTTHKREIKVLENRAAEQSDKVVICHEYTGKDAPSYPNKEGL